MSSKRLGLHNVVRGLLFIGIASCSSDPEVTMPTDMFRWNQERRGNGPGLWRWNLRQVRRQKGLCRSIRLRAKRSLYWQGLRGALLFRYDQERRGNGRGLWRWKLWQVRG